MATWVFYIAQWVTRDFFGAPSLALFQWLLMVYLLFRGLTRARALALSLLLFSLVISHATFSLVTLIVLSIFLVLKHFRSSRLVALYSVSLATWYLYGAWVFTETEFPKIISNIFNFYVLSSTVGRVKGSEAHAFVAVIRIVYTVFIGLFALSGIYLTWRHKGCSNTDKKALALIAGVMILFLLSIHYAELAALVYLCILPIISYFASKNVDCKRAFALMAIFLVAIAPPLYTIARYGNEELDYVSSGEIKGIEFFHNITTHGYIIGEFYLMSYTKQEHYSFFDLTNARAPAKLKWEGGSLTVEGEDFTQHRPLSWPVYICIGRGDKVSYKMFNNNPTYINELQSMLDASPFYNRVYANPDINLYIMSFLMPF
jgi:hypothetical protein